MSAHRGILAGLVTTLGILSFLGDTFQILGEELGVVGYLSTQEIEGYGPDDPYRNLALDASWIQTTQEDLLSGSLSGTDANISTGNLILGKPDERFTTREDFMEGTIRWNVRIKEEGRVALNHAVSLTRRPVLAIGKSIGCAWQDPNTEEIYFGTGWDGLTVLRPDGTCITYRTTGVWDITRRPVGTLISPVPRIGINGVKDIWKDMETGDVYVCTENGGLNIIHTYNTLDPGDDRVDMYDDYTTPAILRNDPENVWKDEEGNVYTGFHKDAGVTIIHPDGTSTSYTGLRGILNTTTSPLYRGPMDTPLISRTPRIGTTWEAHPLFRDEDGNLYVGTDRGLTVLYYNPELKRYDRSATYRSTGVWDTTEDPEGTLISPTPKIVTGDGFCVLHPDNTVTTYTPEYTDDPVSSEYSMGDLVFHAWRDTNGDVYLSAFSHIWKDSEGNIYNTGSGGLHIIRPDRTVTVYAPTSEMVGSFGSGYLGRAISGWRDSEGHFYTVVAVDSVLPSWARSSWKDANGNLYIVCSRGIVMIPPDSKASIEGVLRSGVTDVRRTGLGLIGWKGEAPTGAKLSVQTRTGDLGAYWIDEFEDGVLPDVSASKPGDIEGIEEVDGKLVVGGISSRLLLFLKMGKHFPKGSIIRLRIRGVGVVGDKYEILGRTVENRSMSVTLNTWVHDDYTFTRLEEGQWTSLIFSPIRKSFYRMVFHVPQCDRFEIDYISVEMPEGWSDWAEASDPYGSLIPNLDEAHPYLQWRAVFSTDDVNAIPVLDEVVLSSDYGAFLPKAIRLDQNYPNPFNVRTTISYYLSEEMSVKLEILNILGQRVSTLVRGRQAAGYHEVLWDGKKKDGRAVGSGVYLCSARAGDFSAVRRMVLLR